MQHLHASKSNESVQHQDDLQTTQVRVLMVGQMHWQHIHGADHYCLTDGNQSTCSEPQPSMFDAAAFGGPFAVPRPIISLVCHAFAKAIAWSPSVVSYLLTGGGMPATQCMDPCHAGPSRSVAWSLRPL